LLQDDFGEVGQVLIKTSRVKLSYVRFTLVIQAPVMLKGRQVSISSQWGEVTSSDVSLDKLG